MSKQFKRPVRKYKRKVVTATLDEPTLLTLRMLGFNVPKLIEELLTKVTDTKLCPCCGRKVKPLIVGRTVASLDLDHDELDKS